MTTLLTETTDTMTEPKAKKRKAPAEPMTFEQIAERKVSEKLAAYRALVARAASGEQLPEADLETAVELLAFFGLPEYSWRRDITARTEYDAAARAESAARAERPGNEKRLAEIADRLKALEVELGSLRQERHRLGEMADHLLAGCMGRQRELETLHPHVLAPLADAVRFRLEQQRRRQGVTLGATS